MTHIDTDMVSSSIRDKSGKLLESVVEDIKDTAEWGRERPNSFSGYTFVIEVDDECNQRMMSTRVSQEKYIQFY